jgi:hypothetical protein
MLLAEVSHLWGVAPYAAIGPNSAWNDTLAIIDTPTGPRVSEMTPSMSDTALVVFQVQTRVRKLEMLGCSLRSRWNWQLVPLGGSNSWPPEGTGVAQGLSDRRDAIANAMIDRGGGLVDLRALVRTDRASTEVWHGRGVAGLVARVVAIVLAPLALVLLCRRVSKDEVGRARVGSGKCARCLYPLAGLSTGADACPECGEGITRHRVGGLV